jgi:hypothetical protein
MRTDLAQVKTATTVAVMTIEDRATSERCQSDPMECTSISG